MPRGSFTCNYSRPKRLVVTSAQVSFCFQRLANCLILSSPLNVSFSINLICFVYLITLLITGDRWTLKSRPCFHRNLQILFLINVWSRLLLRKQHQTYSLCIFFKLENTSLASTSMRLFDRTLKNRTDFETNEIVSEGSMITFLSFQFPYYDCNGRTIILSITS